MLSTGILICKHIFLQEKRGFLQCARLFLSYFQVTGSCQTSHCRFRHLRLKQRKLRDYVSEMVDLPKVNGNSGWNILCMFHCRAIEIPPKTLISHAQAFYRLFIARCSDTLNACLKISIKCPRIHLCAGFSGSERFSMWDEFGV